MGRAPGVVILCCALASCQGFHIPVTTTSNAISSSRHSHAAQQCYGRRPGTALGMSEEATAEKDEVVEAVVVEDGAAAAEGAEAGKEGGRRSGSSRQDLYKNQPKPQKKKPWSTEEQKYLDKMANAPVIYKRNKEQEFYPSVGYESSYPTLADSLKETYTGDSTVVAEDGKEEILMRVIVVGGGEEEGDFLANLSEKGSGKLVDGLYALWDPREGELSDKIAKVERMNVHELGSTKTKDPVEVAKHAYFMMANMLVAVSKHPSYGDDYVPRLKKEALEKGLTFVGPDLAAKVAKGDMEEFTKLVKATREALKE